MDGGMGVAIYFLSGDEKTQVRGEKEALVSLTTQRGYSIPLLFFFSLEISAAVHPVDLTLLHSLEECLNDAEM